MARGSAAIAPARSLRMRGSSWCVVFTFLVAAIPGPSMSASP